MVMRIRLKVKEVDGVEYVAVNVSAKRDESLVILMHDELPSMARVLSTDEWNGLPHVWFESVPGPAEKTDYKVPV